MNQPRPIYRLNQIAPHFSIVHHFIEDSLKRKGKDIPDWAPYVFIPMGLWDRIFNLAFHSKSLSKEDEATRNKAKIVYGWRYTQGIYRPHPHFLQAITNTKISGTIPADVLLRLPEWYIYVETPGLTRLDGETIHGFYACLDRPYPDRPTLFLQADYENGMETFPIELGNFTVSDAIENMINRSNEYSEKLGFNTLELDDEYMSYLKHIITPFISILLYICSDKPEIDNTRKPGDSPTPPQLKKTKKGLKLFPAKGPTFWTVGNQTGEALAQAANNAQSAGDGSRSVRTHIRNGHWHGFWKGPRAGQRTFIYHWISPLIVRGSHEQEEQGKE